MTVHFLIPAPLETISGGYLYDRRIIAGLRDLGERVAVVALPGCHPDPDEIALAGARHALAALPPDAPLIIDGLGLPAFLPLSDELAGRRSVALIHHPTSLESGLTVEQRSRLEAAEYRLFQSCRRLIATSAATARTLSERFGIAPERIGVVEPGTDPAPRATGSGGPGCMILSVGARIPRKGHDVLLRALAQLWDLEWRLTIVGDAGRDPVHAGSLAALAESLGLAGRVDFRGEVAETVLAALYHRADLFALATRWEGYGMAAAEALARGLPLALTAGGAVATIVPPEAAVISPVDDWASLSRGLRRLICDRDLRSEMAEAAWRAGQRLPRWHDRAVAFRAELDKILF